MSGEVSEGTKTSTEGSAPTAAAKGAVSAAASLLLQRLNSKAESNSLQNLQ